MHRAVLPALLSLAACDTAPPPSACGDSLSSDPSHLTIGATIQQATLESDGTLSIHEVAVDCATYTVQQDGDSDWQVTGTTPDSLALAPDAYVVEVDFFDEDGRCAYVSDPVLVDHDLDHRQLTVPLCVDMSGTWQCEDGQASWSAPAEMVGGCSLALEGVSSGRWLNGHLIEDVFGTVVIDAAGRTLSADTGSRRIDCSRLD